jgi:hypothetical protein
MGASRLVAAENCDRSSSGSPKGTLSRPINRSYRRENYLGEIIPFGSEAESGRNCRRSVADQARLPAKLTRFLGTICQVFRQL